MKSSSPSPTHCLRESIKPPRRFGSYALSRPASMKNLLRPNRSSRFAPHTVPMTKTSISMKRCARYPAARGVLPALVLSGAAFATRGGGVVSASSEASTKKSTAAAKLSDDEKQRGAIARAFNVQPRLIIAEDPPGVRTAHWSEDCRVLAIDGDLAADHRAGRKT